MSERRAGRGLLAEHPAGGRCTRAGKSAAAPAAGMCSLAPQGAGFPARVEVALVDEDGRAVLFPWAAAGSTAVTSAVEAPSQRAA